MHSLLSCHLQSTRSHKTGCLMGGDIFSSDQDQGTTLFDNMGKGND